MLFFAAFAFFVLWIIDDDDDNIFCWLALVCWLVYMSI